MRIHRSQIEFSAYDVLLKLVDSLIGGYTIEPLDTVDGEPEKFVVMLGSSDLAIATFDGDEFSFDFSAGKKAEVLESLLKQKYTDELQWLVLYPLRGSWSYSGKPEATAELAMKAIEEIAFRADDQPQLVAFRSSKWPDQMLEVEHCWMIYGTSKNYRQGTEDGGRQLFELTTEE